MGTVRAHAGDRARVAKGIRGAGRATLGWLRGGQLGSADGHDIWSHPAGQWRF
jgi:hypothetical protein